MKKVFEIINLDIQEVEDFINENGLSFVCNDKMQVEASEEDFDKLIAQFPELDYVEADPSEKYNFYIRLKDRVESKLARTFEADMDEEQIRRECLDILGTWQGDCPMGVDVYKNGDFLLSEDIEDEE